MCYDVQALTKKIVKYAESRGANPAEVAALLKELEKLKDKKPIFHTNAYEHTALPIFTNQQPLNLQFYQWGLVPRHISNAKSAYEISNKTLNARSETIFETPSFKEAIICRRCIVMVDGFFEHHHKAGKTFPFFISKKNEEPMYLAGIYETTHIEGQRLDSFSIITTKANSLMGKIHNNPQMAEGRMPVILDKEDFDQWFNGKVSNKQDNEIADLFKAYNEQQLTAYPVAKIRGKDAQANHEKITTPYTYKELKNGLEDSSNTAEQLSLF